MKNKEGQIMKRAIYIAITLLLLVPALSLAAQEKPDTIYTFRFCTGKDMFLVPTFGNDKELARLEECIETYRSEIHSGQIPLYVDGYCKSAKTQSENLAIAKTRSNRVKSELIVRDGLKEEHFITRNHTGKGDFVTVRIIVPKAVAAVPGNDDQEDAAAPPTTGTSVGTPAVREAANDVRETPVTEPAVTEVPQKTTGIRHFSIRTDLLRWATLTPDLGIEWRINRHVGIAVDGSWTSWSWNGKDRRYALWEVAPEVRWYLGKEKRGYIGAMYKAGEFNYKFSGTGRQGDLMGGCITGGYQLRLNRTLALDFSLGLGCLHADYDKYIVIDNVRVRRGKGTKDWWGPVQAGVTLVWAIF